MLAIVTLSIVGFSCGKVPLAPKGWTLSYEVQFNEGSDKAEVAISLDDPNAEVHSLYLRVLPSGYITNLHAEDSEIRGDKWVVGDVTEATLSYTININVKYKEDGYSSYADSNWIVTAGSFLFIIDEWRGTPGHPSEVRMKVTVPHGWAIYTPYPKISFGEFDATEVVDKIIPRDFIFAGKPGSYQIATRRESDVDFTVITVETERVEAQHILDFLINLHPIYSQLAAYAPSTVFAVIVPEPMRRYGGEATGASILVSDNNPFPFDLSWGSSAYAHEFFHLYQRYYTNETWLKEGVAYYYQQYGPFKAGYMTAEEFWNVLVNVISERADKDAILALNQDVYFKGSLVTMALDIKIRQDTDNEFSFDDVFRRMNINYAHQYVSSTVLREITQLITGKDYTDFFNKYVYGSGYPDEIFASAGPELYEEEIANSALHLLTLSQNLTNPSSLSDSYNSVWKSKDAEARFIEICEYVASGLCP